MHSLTPTHSPRDQRLKFCYLSALSISLLLFTVIHLKHIIPNHTPSFRPSCHTAKPLDDIDIVKGERVDVKVDSINRPHGHRIENVVFIGENQGVKPEKSHEGPRHNAVDEVAAWGFVNSDGEQAKVHQGHHTENEAAAWGFVAKAEKEVENIRTSPHRFSIADLDIWRLLAKYRNTGEKAHQNPHLYSIADLNIWKLLTKQSHPEDQQILGEEVMEKTQMHGNGGEVCDSFFVSDLVGCAKVVNGKFRGGEGRKKLGGSGEDWAKIEEAKERVMRKEGLR